jgi:hypothetical protein
MQGLIPKEVGTAKFRGTERQSSDNNQHFD